eukprot:COSAG02_NODE_55943_length_288_cov_0.507937_1_plen_39_part_01
MYLPAIGTMPAAYKNPCSHAPVNPSLFNKPVQHELLRRA